MESEPDYGQYWAPDGRSAQDQGSQQSAYEQSQPGHDQPSHDQTGYEHPGHESAGYEQQPGYEPTGYQQPTGYEQQSGYEQPGYGQSGYEPGYQQGGYQQQSGYDQSGYDQSGYEQPGYEQQPAPDAYLAQQPGYQSDQGYPQYDYAGYQGSYSEYPEQQPYSPEQSYGGVSYDGHQAYDGLQAAPGQEQESESTATWSAAERYQPGNTDTDTDATASANADASADASTVATDGDGELVAAGSAGSTAVGGGGRSARRAARGGAVGSSSGSAEAGAPTFARLLAAATGRAPGTDRKTFIVRAALGAAALVVLGVAGFAVAGGGSGGAKPKTAAVGAPSVDLATAHTKAWAAPADAGSAHGNDGLVGSWLLSDAVVRGDGMGVTAYSTSGGSKLWTVAPPVAGAVPCGMSSTVNAGGVGAVLFQAKPGSGQACTLLVAVNTTTGASSWKATLPSSPIGQTSVMVNDTQVVAVEGSAATGYAAATGKQSWSYAGPGKYCVLSGNGTAGTLLLESTCADTNPKQQLISLNADTGKLGWWRGLPQNAASFTVLSATPAVVAVHMTNPTQDTLMSFTAQGDSQAGIPVSQVGGLLDSLHGSFDPDPALFFQGTTMLAELSPTTTPAATGGSSTQAASSGSSSGVITAFDLATGKQLWQTAPAEKGQSALVGLDGLGAVVATEERIGQPARLSHFDLSLGKEVPGGAFPQGTGSLLTAGRVLFQGSQVAVLPQFTSTWGTAATFYTGGSSS